MSSPKETFRVSGKKAAVPTQAPWKFTVRPGGWIVAEREGVRRRFMLSEAQGKLSAAIGGSLWHGEWATASRGGSAAGGSDADLTAQFPGKVRKILVKAGQGVVEGEPLVLVEAMKMEFAVKAPFAGVVKKVLVTEGQQLSPGTRFVDLEAASG